MKIEKLMDINPAKPKGWDVADYLEEGEEENYVETCRGISEQETKNTAFPVPEIAEGNYREPMHSKKAFYQRLMPPLLDKFIRDTYTKGGLVRYGSIFWAWDSCSFYFEIEHQADIRGELQLWLNEQEIIKDYDYRYIRRELEDMLDRLRLSDAPKKNPFKISPRQIHFRNGAVILDGAGGWEWKQRKQGDSWFLRQYPLRCAPYDLDLNVLAKALAGEKPGTDSYPHFWKICEGIAGGDQGRASQILDYISQLVGYIFQPEKNEPLFWMFTGAQATGKTLVVSLIKQIIGESAVLERPIKELQDNRFAMADAVGKLLYVDTDAARTAVNGSFLKTLLGSGTKTIEHKNKPAISGVMLSITAIIVSNYDSKIKDMDGVKRRAQVFKFSHPVKNPDPLMLDRLTGKRPMAGEENSLDERGAIAALGVAALLEYEKRGHKLDVPEWIKADTARWIDNSNTALEFMAQFELQESAEDEIKQGELYSQYQEWCEQEGYAMPMGKHGFFSEIRRHDRVDERHARNGDMFIIAPLNWQNR